MKYSEGQFIVGEIFMFSASIMLTVVVFLLLVAAGNTVDRTVGSQVDYSIGEINKRSVITVTMRDYMWRSERRQPFGSTDGGAAPPDYHDISRDEYGDMSASKVMSYYYSAQGNSVYINGERKSKSEVREDIENYIKYKMDLHWRRGIRPTEYYLNLSATQVSGAPDPIVVRSGGYEPSGRWSRLSYPIALTGGQEATITLWTTTSQDVQTVRSR